MKYHKHELVEDKKVCSSTTTRPDRSIRLEYVQSCLLHKLRIKLLQVHSGVTNMLCITMCTGKCLDVDVRTLKRQKHLLKRGHYLCQWTLDHLTFLYATHSYTHTVIHINTCSASYSENSK